MNLINAILETPKGPCEVHKCSNWAVCQQNELACLAFQVYVDDDKLVLPTQPDSKIYRAIFEEGEWNERLF